MQILGLFGMNFDALVFVTKFSLLFRLDLAMLCFICYVESDKKTTTRQQFQTYQAAR